MTDKVIRVNVTSSKSQKVTVSSSKVANEITASPDTSAYYSRLAKNWAIAEGLVENIDYSSKHYAQESKASADMAKTYEISTQENYNMFMESSFNANSELQTNRDGALADIEGAKTSAIDSLNSVKDENISTIESKANEEIENFENLSEQEQNKIIDLGIDTRANVDLSNLTQEGEKHFLNKSQVTNCITEIPQRIKYTLEDGTLTIKAGSVVIVPYGVEDLTSQYPKGATFIHKNFKVYDTQFTDGKFFVWAEMQNDIVNSDTSSNTNIIVNTIQLQDNTVYRHINSESGTATASSKTYTVYYKTDLNLIRYCTTTTTFEDLEEVVSLPILLSVGDGTNYYGTVSQVFNGFGYIGSTIWVDKGVKGLIPNGRNEDGTLKNIEITIDRLWTRNTAGITDTSTAFIIYDLISINMVTIGTLFQGYFHSEPTAKQYGCYFNIVENRWYYSADGKSWMTRPWVACGSLVLSNSGATISNFNPKLPFRAIDYSDKSEVSGWGLPSNKYINLTLGASGSSYTAPANGWFYVAKKSGSTNQSVTLFLNGSNAEDCLGTHDIVPASGQTARDYIVCQKGDVVKIDYSCNGATVLFRFYYAEGEV